jgi:hypothetical protein
MGKGKPTKDELRSLTEENLRAYIKQMMATLNAGDSTYTRDQLDKALKVLAKQSDRKAKIDELSKDLGIL